MVLGAESSPAGKSRRLWSRVPLIGGLVCACGLILTYSGPCQAAEPNNIIIFVVDDLDWNDLPFFSAPLDAAAYENLKPYYLDETLAPRNGEPTLIQPAANRFAARAFAVGPSTANATANFGSFRAQLSDNRQLSYTVSPLDRSTGDATTFAVDTTACTDQRAQCSVCPPSVCSDCCGVGGVTTCECDAKTDILSGFGGLARLMDQGVMFPRFYANSAKCAPSRAALMTGRYPARTGVVNNGASLGADEVTIAEFLKQGCTNSADPASTPLTKQCFDGTNFAPCACYLDPATDCGGKACYRTGLVGKWHLGDDKRSPWAQGFDEFFGFGGGSRHYWNTRQLQCSPSPKFCNDRDANGVITSVTSTLCQSLQDCVPPDNLTLSEFATCDERGSYIGTRQSFNDCLDGVGLAARTDPACCEPSGERGKFVIRKKIYDPALVDSDPVHKAKGRDSRKDSRWPCNNDGLTHQTHCAYLTRVLRDQARNFIVRNSDRQPYLLIVTFHATHVAHAAPIRTEAHYRTEDTVEKDTFKRPRAPSSASKKWGSLEELDAAVGEVMAVLENTGVCRDDPRIDCTDDADCSGVPGGPCLAIGRCQGSTTACMASTTSPSCTCEPPRDNTYVFFTSDQGSPNKRPDGSPGLRGHKGDVFEAGVRTGLLVRGPATAYRCVNDSTRVVVNPAAACDPVAPNCDVGETCLWRGTNLSQASIVDLFATVADLAGYPTSSVDGRLAGFSASPAGVIDSRSFASVIDNPIGVSALDRDFNYASFPGAGATVVSAQDHFNASEAARVCSFDALGVATTLHAPVPYRRVRGGSCEVCGPSTPTIDCTSKRCRLEGKVCVDLDNPALGQLCNLADGTENADSKDYCATYSPTATTTPAPACDPADPNPSTCRANLTTAAYRCEKDGDCPSTLNCQSNVWVDCNRCEAATWKLKANNGGNTVTALFDLTSNPGEERRLNFLYEQCDEKLTERTSTSLDPVYDDVIGPLSTGVEGWKSCVSNAACTTPY